MENKYSKHNTTRKKVKFLGTKEFIDASIDEKQTIRDVMFIIENNNKENKLIITYRVIAEKTNTSLQNVSETMKALQESNLLSKIRNGYYRVKPDVIFKGGRNDRMNVLLRYSK